MMFDFDRWVKMDVWISNFKTKQNCWKKNVIFELKKRFFEAKNLIRVKNDF